MKLVKEGITDQLLALLRDKSEQVSPTLQHATFSALRNLAIPSKYTMLNILHKNCTLLYQYITVILENLAHLKHTSSV